MILGNKLYISPHLRAASSSNIQIKSAESIHKKILTILDRIKIKISKTTLEYIIITLIKNNAYPPEFLDWILTRFTFIGFLKLLKDKNKLQFYITIYTQIKRN
jgi:hypothetical protein